MIFLAGYPIFAGDIPFQFSAALQLCIFLLYTLRDTFDQIIFVQVEIVAFYTAE